MPFGSTTWGHIAAGRRHLTCRPGPFCHQWPVAMWPLLQDLCQYTCVGNACQPRSWVPQKGSVLCSGHHMSCLRYDVPHAESPCRPPWTQHQMLWCSKKCWPAGPRRSGLPSVARAQSCCCTRHCLWPVVANFRPPCFCDAFPPRDWCRGRGFHGWWISQGGSTTAHPCACGGALLLRFPSGPRHPPNCRAA